MSRMGLLDKLWDDVVAGPQPAKGLGKLRKGPANAGGVDLEIIANEELTRMAERRRSGEFQDFSLDARRVSRSIAIRKKPPMLDTTSEDSQPSTPTEASPIASPSMMSPGFRGKEQARQSIFKENNRSNMNPMSPTVYDWVVISALDK